MDLEGVTDSNNVNVSLLDLLPEDVLEEILKRVPPFKLRSNVGLVSSLFLRLGQKYFGFERLEFSATHFLPGFTLHFQKLLSGTRNGAVNFFEHVFNFPLLLAISKAMVRE